MDKSSIIKLKEQGYSNRKVEKLFILESEKGKEKILGTNKQCLTKIQIYELLKKSGFNVGYSTVVAEINKIKRSGNEKGYVKGSVKYLRNKIFAENYKFPSEEAAIQYMESQLLKLNENSKIEEEKKFERYDLVILDELGYVSFDKEGCEILFNLLSNRNDKGSIIITTNLTLLLCFASSATGSAKPKSS